ncbi:MAG: hypothetical protein M1457_09230 [bacterium]|nr:hypothetical protein [bacterium]
MDSRERFHAVMNYQPVDHPIFRMPGYGGFEETLVRWRGEGYKDGDLAQYKTDQWNWIAWLFFPNPPFERQVIEDDGRHILYVNHEGILMRELKVNPRGSMPQFVRFPVQTRDDFRRFVKERLQPDMTRRIGPDWVDKLKAWRAQPAMLMLMSDRWGGFFGPLRNLLGVEELCKMFYLDPGFVEEMMDTVADFIIAMMDQILDHIQVDAYAFWEDMAFRVGPLIGPDMVRTYMLPRYKRVVEHLRGRGVQWIGLDSDGQVDSLIPVWLDAGINLLWPFEVAAGMDVVACRKKYGRQLRMIGGVAKRPLVIGGKAIDEEIERVRPLIEDGGYVADLDHSVPPDISYDNFRHYLDKMAKVLGV